MVSWRNQVVAVEVIVVAKQFAPGKAFITGEHSVIYGYPALTTSLAIGITVGIEKANSDANAGENHYYVRKDNTTKPDNLIIANAIKVFEEFFKVELQHPVWCNVISQLPMGYELGSSSALASAFILALSEAYGVPITLDQLAKLVWRTELQLNNQADPIDAYTIAEGGVWQFSRTQGWTYQAVFGSAISLASCLLIFTGQSTENPSQMKTTLANFLAGNDRGKQTLAELGELVPQYIETMERGLSLVELIRVNHRLLAELPLMSESTLAMVAQIEQAGGGAKITGAGGQQTGSGYLLACHQDVMQLISLCQQRGWSYLPVA